MEEMQAMMQINTQTAIKAARAVVKSLTEVEDSAKGSTRRNVAGNAGQKGEAADI